MTWEERVEFLVDHSKRRRNRKVLPDASFVRSGGNPGCGDLVTIYGQVEGDRLAQVTFEAEGCILSQAGASIVTEMASGLAVAEAEQLSYDRLFDVIGQEVAMARIRCATMALDTLRQALRFYAIRRQLEAAEAPTPPG